MLISRTPFRVSFFGGGTDYPDWYHRHGGAVLSTTIDKYCHISSRWLPPFFNNRHRIVWSHIENVNSISEILHPAVKAGLQSLGFDDTRGLEIHHQGDLPARSGMGSSSSFAVGLINALKALREESITKEELAQAAIDLEQNAMGENVGSQDQVAAAHGGLNRIEFGTDGSISVEPLNISQERKQALESNLLMFYTGTSRLASEIAGKWIANLSEQEAALKKMHSMVDKACSTLTGEDRLDTFGELLHETWQIKRELAGGITNKLVDSIYKTARSSGALGGKLLGAGGSGFMLFYAPSERRDEVIQALSSYLHVPIKLESSGSVIINPGPEAKNEAAKLAQV